jgi:DNA-binding GntR family transcriptional regulator
MAKGNPKLSILTPSPSLKEMALNAIKEAILTNELQPGTLYKEQAIANELGISKTPVREALLELASRGFITFFRRKGFEIKPLDEETARDLIELRIILETAVIRHITPGMTDSTIKELETIADREKKYSEANNLRQIRKVNRELHHYLASLTGNEYLISSLENINDLVQRLVALTLEVQEREGVVLDQHVAIIEMLKKRDTEGAVSMMEVHVRSTEKYILDGIRVREELDRSNNSIKK